MIEEKYRFTDTVHSQEPTAAIVHFLEVARYFEFVTMSNPLHNTVNHLIYC